MLAAGLAAGFGRGLDFGLGGAFGSTAAGGAAATAGFGFGFGTTFLGASSTGLVLRTHVTFGSLNSSAIVCCGVSTGQVPVIRQFETGGGGGVPIHGGLVQMTVRHSGQPGVRGVQTGGGGGGGGGQAG